MEELVPVVKQHYHMSLKTFAVFPIFSVISSEVMVFFCSDSSTGEFPLKTNLLCYNLRNSHLGQGHYSVTQTIQKH